MDHVFLKINCPLILKLNFDLSKNSCTHVFEVMGLFPPVHMKIKA